MAYKRKQKKGDKVELSMTPMIDVVFQLLIFFVVNLKQEDILAKLTAARPAPNQKKEETLNQDPPITIIVDLCRVQESTKAKLDSKGRTVRDRNFEKIIPNYFFNGSPVSLAQLDGIIQKLASRSTKAMVVIECRNRSLHAGLVKVLDICYKNKMTNLSIFSRAD